MSYTHRTTVVCANNVQGDEKIHDPKLQRPLNPMPDFIQKALEGRELMTAYQARPAFRHNDYIGWICRAKLQETKEKRIGQMFDEFEADGVSMKMKHSASRIKCIV